MREHVRRGDHLRRPVLVPQLRAELLVEERLHGLHSVLDRDLRDVRRLDAQHAHPLLREAQQERAVVRADVDDERVGLDGGALDHGLGGRVQVAPERGA